MFFKCSHHAAQHFNGHIGRWLVNFDDLKAPRQSRVAFDVFFVLCPSGGSNCAQLSTSQRRFEQIGCVSLALCTARTNELMSFVNEQNHGCWRGLDLCDHRLEPIFKLALHACSGLKQGQIQRADRHIFQSGRDFTAHNTLRKSLNHSRLTHTRLAGENRVVLSSAQQHVDDLADFVITAADRVHLAVTRLGRDVCCELIKGWGG